MLISRSWGQQLPSVSSSWSVAPRRSWTSHSCGDTATSRATPATSSRFSRVRSTAAAVVYYLAALLLSCTCEGAGLCGWCGPEVGEGAVMEVAEVAAEMANMAILAAR